MSQNINIFLVTKYYKEKRDSKKMGKSHTISLGAVAVAAFHVVVFAAMAYRKKKRENEE